MPAIDVENTEINDFDPEFDSIEQSDDFDGSEDSEETEERFEEEVKEAKKETKKAPEPAKAPLKSVSATRVGRKKKQEAEKEQEKQEKELTEKERLAAATDLKKSRELPRLPVEKKGGKVDKKTFFEWISLLTEPQWSRVLVYCYRLFPKIDRTLKYPTGDKNIDIISENVSELDFLGRHGGGKYRFLVVDTESEERDNKLFVCEAEWAWHEHPPVIDYETLLISDKDNKAYVGWATSKGLLVAPEKKDDNSKNVDPVTQKLLDVFLDERKQKPREEGESRRDRQGDLVNTLIAKVLENNSPDKQLSVVTQLLTALKPAAPPTPEFTLKDILEMQRQEAAKREELLVKFFLKEEKEKERQEANKEEPKSLAEQIKEAKELAGLLGIGGGGGNSDWVDKLAPFLQMGVAMLGQFLQSRGGAVPGANNPGVVQPVSPFAPTQITQPLNQPLNQPTQPVNPEIPGVNDMNLDPRVAMLKQAIGVVAQPMINTMNKGETGYDFAIWVIDGYGRQIYDMVSSAGSEQLLTVMKDMPELWGYIVNTANEEKFSRLVAEFCDREKVEKVYKGEDEEDEEVEQPKKIEDLL